VSVSHRSISRGCGLINEPLLASDASPQSSRHLATPPSYRYWSYRAVAIRERWVICLFGVVFQSKLTFLIINCPAAAVSSADLRFLELRTPLHSSPRSISTVSICSEGEKVSSLIVFLLISPETHLLFLLPHDVPPAGDN
jgi:hypothetical protein